MPAAARTYPFSAVVGAQDMALALILTTVSPEVGGVLVRGEKGTAKTTMVRALAHVLPPLPAVPGCRFRCDPADPDPECPDGPHIDAVTEMVPARLVELPVGASEDRVVGSIDLRQALGPGRSSTPPVCSPPRTAACSTSTRSTCCTITWSTSCWTPPPPAGRRWNGRVSRSRTPPGWYWSAP